VKYRARKIRGKRDMQTKKDIKKYALMCPNYEFAVTFLVRNLLKGYEHNLDVEILKEFEEIVVEE
jgi:hypothetical protein